MHFEGERDMNSVIEQLLTRRTHRSFSKEPITKEHLHLIQEATLRSPSAGNMMFYSVIDVQDQSIKEQLAVLCDNQPMIGTAPLVWVFLADVRKWENYYHQSGSVAHGESIGVSYRRPGAGDLLLAYNDALIAAQSAVVAADSLGIGSCYIGDILENFEQVSQLLELPQYTAVATMLIFGYPKNPNPLPQPSLRCPSDAIFMKDKYKEPTLSDVEYAFKEQEQRLRDQQRLPFENSGTISDYYYFRKHTSDFMREMNRSAQKIIEFWTEE